ncbi:VapC toxin family PIN domain ribonuclease [Candidatus Pacearchaeota archaeon]|nr:VapC toxin family PIN domain ribonuclease [Candidatus Pacearchaeota archaeon]|tara:strand:- start:2661 stop:3041 length:381 start_codon:yes stop_codon:yes gene_type:complete
MKGEKRDSELLDSSVWIAYFIEGIYKEVIESEARLLVSTLSLFEIKKILLSKKIDSKVIDEKVSYMKRRCVVIPVSSPIAEEASIISVEKKIPAIDSIIYVSGKLNKAMVVSLDNDFRGLEGAIVL